MATVNQYLLLIHGNTRSEASASEWSKFFASARASGLFKGGSELGERVIVGEAEALQSTAHIVGFMRFDSEDKQLVLDLLKEHPVVKHGGSVELCVMPTSGSGGGREISASPD